MLANLEKARAAPKEKVYRPSEKRRAANQANLQKAHAARAAARVEKQAFSERFDRLFPLLPPQNPSAETGTEVGPEAGIDAVREVAEPDQGGQDGRAPGTERGIEGVREVAEQVWKRRRFYPLRARSEGRKVMRLLTAAAQSPAPGSAAEEALHLLRQLLEIFLQSKAVGQAERLNAEVKRLLQEMLEQRYGQEVFVNGFSAARAVQGIEADLKRRAERKAERAGRRAANEEPAAGEDSAAEGEEEKEEATVEPPREAEGAWAVPPQGPDASSADGQPIPSGRVPELPEKFDDFLKIFFRAFPPPIPQRGTAAEGERVLLCTLAWAVWERLHVYERQVRQEEVGLRRALDELGTQAVESYPDLRVRAQAIESAFQTEPTLGQVRAKLEENIELGINQFVKWRYGSDLDHEVFPPPPRTSGEWRVASDNQ